MTLTLSVGDDGEVSSRTEVADVVILTAAERATLKRVSLLGAAYEAPLSVPESVSVTVQMLRRRRQGPTKQPDWLRKIMCSLPQSTSQEIKSRNQKRIKKSHRGLPDRGS
ncbi:MAG: hypothetical protein VX113_09535, partial [Pseudomonadota bacterium]|nr:hypothetical protein [Pseudomonadota bacterium]